jgi:hypothetical protein
MKKNIKLIYIKKHFARVLTAGKCAFKINLGVRGRDLTRALQINMTKKNNVKESNLFMHPIII